VQSSELADFIGRYPNPEWVRRGREMPLWVDRERAVFGAWYELFPRSTSPDPNRAGTFRDTINLLPRLQELGMNVLYLPPIHPIGVQHRKGRNNSTTAMPGEPGCPWAIGGLEGGHKSLHPELGGWSDFRALVEAAKGHGMELALDYALQCSPDHPYVREHPQWFRWRPDGTIQYAENPPKKYQDVLPLNFESSDWQALWQELLDVLLFWINEGIHIFRVDNPHTKSFHFWSWCIGEVHRKHPEVLFLSEAFTDPERMKELARIGFTQSYTYFTWRNHKQELQAYVEELTQTEMKHYFRPNFWPNTPDINPIPLQGAPEALFMTRLFMAATLSSTYGMYGPVYEFALSAPMEGKEEYIDSEKYEVRHWDWSHSNRITELLRRLNKARLLHPALQRTANIRFCAVDSDELMAYVKCTADRSDRILAVVNLNPHESRQGMVRLDLDDLQLPHDQPFVAHDLLTDERYAWRGSLNFVALHPGLWPVHLLHLSTI
jgi:starch synthase (maltosyl-transferring)